MTIRAAVSFQTRGFWRIPASGPCLHDVTGYSFIGHLVEMVRRRGLTAMIDMASLPVLGLVEDCLSRVVFIPPVGHGVYLRPLVPDSPGEHVRHA